jgi:hypothetical protein
LVSKGANVRSGDDWELRRAADWGHLDTVKYLVEKCGADVHACDDLALRWAARSGHINVVKYLVSKGADVHADDDEDDEALLHAARNGHLDVVQYLVEECGVDVHVNDEYAICCAGYWGHLEIVKYLKLSQFTKKHIDKQNLRYVFQQYELPFEIKQLISSYVLKKGRTIH